ncbi:hypothetical protein BO223_04515 [Faecalibaculum rodentium]|uniref:Uncharacterized protein n=1 Tax=Faecalibaculum rodentium TaxID=1702221 RepID=A0A1Q9YL55_9FIRM|nr:hypothetical protein BO223_04515 [Faecalibaculum rodentium]
MQFLPQLFDFFCQIRDLNRSRVTVSQHLMDQHCDLFHFIQCVQPVSCLESVPKFADPGIMFQFRMQVRMDHFHHFPV